MDYTVGAKALPVVCPHCDCPVPQKPGQGRVRLYCTPDAGKQYRRRLRALGIPL
ncbi:hypothetical protein ABZ782_03860 [Streptomyces asoensis]|uniref:hypothetical protein n=1 Tax=Streptomyces asoensis TaxID=249586 RepID=UPI0033D45687